MHEQSKELPESSSGAAVVLFDDVTRSMATRALALSLVEWDDVGSGADQCESAAASSAQGGEVKKPQHKAATDHEEFQQAVEGIVALLLVRLAAAWDATTTTAAAAVDDSDSDSEGSDMNVRSAYVYSDYSAEKICRQTLHEGKPWPFLRQHCDDNSAESLVSQVRRFVTTILGWYDSNLPYHNYKHAYHVVLSVNKLLDLLLRRPTDDDTNPHGPARLPPLFGLRRDANLQLALVFAALVHDVGHHGVTNQQLVRESHPIALLYNDTSVQEHNSLTLAFQTLLLDQYAILRACMFPLIGEAGPEDDPALNNHRMDDEAFQRFRSSVIGLVLSTDIANPERSQLGKAVYKEAFRAPTEAGGAVATDRGPSRSGADNRRGSMTREISMPRIAKSPYNQRYPRRRSSHSSVCSLTSDVTSDSVARMMMKGSGAPTTEERVESADPPSQLPATFTRRGSMNSDYDSVAFLHRRQNPSPRPTGYSSRRLSNAASVESEWTENGMDSIDLRRNGKATNQRVKNRLLLHNQQSFSSSNFEDLEHATLTSSPSRSTRNPRSTRNTLGSESPSQLLTQVEAQERRAAAAHRHEQPRQRSRISRRWSTEMSGQSLSHGGSNAGGGGIVGTPSQQQQQVSRLVHEYYGYGDGDMDNDDSASDDGNSSLSLTPPSSDDEMDGVVITGLTLSSSSTHGSLPVGGAIVIARKKKKNESDGDGARASTYRNSALLASRRASTGMSTSFRRASGTLNASIMNGKSAAHGRYKDADDVLKGKDGWVHHPHRRHSSDDGATSSKIPLQGKRLGIRRSMDLSGESIEKFSSSNHTSRHYRALERRSSLGAMSTFSAEDGIANNDYYHDFDEPDELKASVIAELLLRLADVGHFFQHYETMVHHSSQSFREILRAHASGRGIDPRPSWFDNQVRIMEGYLLPLAHQLEATGVFLDMMQDATTTRSGDSAMVNEERKGSRFSLVRNLEANHDQWLRQGFDVVASLLQETPPSGSSTMFFL